jgi:hypothetical protein
MVSEAFELFFVSAPKKLMTPRVDTANLVSAIEVMGTNQGDHLSLHISSSLALVGAAKARPPFIIATAYEALATRPLPSENE